MNNTLPERSIYQPAPKATAVRTIAALGIAERQPERWDAIKWEKARRLLEPVRASTGTAGVLCPPSGDLRHRLIPLQPCRAGERRGLMRRTFGLTAKQTTAIPTPRLTHPGPLDHVEPCADRRFSRGRRASEHRAKPNGLTRERGFTVAVRPRDVRATFFAYQLAAAVSNARTRSVHRSATGRTSTTQPYSRPGHFCAIAIASASSAT